MRYSVGERIDFLPMTTEAPEAAVFQLSDMGSNPVMQPLTVVNGGLVERRKNALHPVFNAPHVPGRYAWKFWDGEQVLSGVIRVDAVKRAEPVVDVEPSGYSGPGSSRRRGR